MPKQVHVVRLPDGSVARMVIVTTGFFRKRSYTELDFSSCSEAYMDKAWSEFSRIIEKKLRKRVVELHFHFSP